MSVSIDYATELELVNDAIAKVLTGGEDVTYNGKRVVKTDLGELRAHRNDLITKIDRQSRGGARVRRGVAVE